MTQARVRFASFDEYLNADLEGLEGLYELIDGGALSIDC